MDELLQKQKKELRALQGETTRMKKSVPKGDKKRKKEVASEIEQMEKDMKEKHQKEIVDFENNESQQTEPNGDENNVSEDLNVSNSMENEEQQASTQNEGKKKSRAQKRREKKEMEAREMERRIKEGTPKEGESEQEIEEALIMEQLSKLSLCISKTVPDGNCLFESVRVQLPNATDVSVRNVREVAAQHMKEHASDFLPFCTTQNGDVMSPDEFSTYCDSMATSNDWGGLPELRALANVYGVVIRVYQAFAPMQEIVGDGVNKDTGHVVNLSYHQKQYGLGAHYNAISHQSQQEMMLVIILLILLLWLTFVLGNKATYRLN